MAAPGGNSMRARNRLGSVARAAVWAALSISALAAPGEAREAGRAGYDPKAPWRLVLSVTMEKSEDAGTYVSIRESERGDLLAVQVASVSEGQVKDLREITLEQLQAARAGQKEISLGETHGRKVALLSTESFSASEGGVVRIRYLVDGRHEREDKRRYGLATLELRPSGTQGRWAFSAEAHGGRFELVALSMRPNVRPAGPLGIVKAIVGVARVTAVGAGGQRAVLPDEQAPVPEG